MTVVEHLSELRFRLVFCLAAFAIGSVVAYVFYDPILEFLTHPVDEAGRIGSVAIDKFYVGGITTAFVLRIKVSVFAGTIFALPVLLFQLWRFVTPGLESREKRYAIPFVFGSLGLFALGVWVAFLILPASIGFLLGFVSGPLEPLIQFHEYLRFVMFTILAFGIAFEFPLLLIFLALAGVVSARSLGRWRHYAIFLVFLVAAVATPSGDPLSQTAMAVPLYVLYELSILIIRFVFKR